MSNITDGEVKILKRHIKLLEDKLKAYESQINHTYSQLKEKRDETEMPIDRILFEQKMSLIFDMRMNIQYDCSELVMEYCKDDVL